MEGIKTRLASLARAESTESVDSIHSTDSFSSLIDEARADTQSRFQDPSSVVDMRRANTPDISGVPLLNATAGGGTRVAYDGRDETGSRSHEYKLPRRQENSTAAGRAHAAIRNRPPRPGTAPDSKTPDWGDKHIPDRLQEFRPGTVVKKIVSKADALEEQRIASAMAMGEQAFYDGPYMVTTLTGDIGIVDLLLVIFLYLPAEVQTMGRASLVCRGWAERVALIPQWRLVPRPQNINVSHFAVKQWVAKQTSAELRRMTRTTDVVDRLSFLDTIRVDVVAAEQERRHDKKRSKVRCGKRALATPFFILFWLSLLAGALGTAYGIGRLHSSGFSTQTQVAAASFFIVLIVSLIIICGCQVFFIGDCCNIPNGRIRKPLAKGWVALGTATVTLILGGSLIVSLISFRISDLENDTESPIVDFAQCTFRQEYESTSTGGDTDTTVLPLVYRFPKALQGSTTLGFSYNYSQSPLYFKHTAFTLLTSSLASAEAKSATGVKQLQSCAHTCDCRIAILGDTLNPGEWASYATLHRPGHAALVRSLTPATFTACPDLGGVDLALAVEMGQALWDQYQIPLIVLKPTTDLELPAVQKQKWDDALLETINVFLVVFAFACTAFIPNRGWQRMSRIFWVFAMCLSPAVMALWGGLCYWISDQAGSSLPTDYCMMTKTSAMVMFVLGLVGTPLSLCGALMISVFCVLR